MARFPDRLLGFCAVSLIRDYALGEIRRCASELRLHGLKMHFGNSGVDVTRSEHLAMVRAVFRAANELRLPIVVHIQRGDDPGVKQAEILLAEVLPVAPDIVVQVAHMAGSGPGWNDDALAVFAAAITKGDARTAHLYFDLATVAEDQSHDRLLQLVRRIRQIGVSRVLYGSDGTFGGRTTPRQQWGMFQGMVPLSEAEIAATRSRRRRLPAGQRACHRVHAVGRRQAPNVQLRPARRGEGLRPSRPKGDSLVMRTVLLAAALLVPALVLAQHEPLGKRVAVHGLQIYYEVVGPGRPVDRAARRLHEHPVHGRDHPEARRDA